LAASRRVRVAQISACERDVALHVFAARLPRRWAEVCILDIGARHLRISDGSREHAFDYVREGRDTIHEDPEAWKGCRAGEDAAGVR
jgi:hypothetical protein